MFSWIIVLWNLNPTATIAIYLLIGYFYTGLILRFRDQINTLFPVRISIGKDWSYSAFVGHMVAWIFLSVILWAFILLYQSCKLLGFFIDLGINGFRLASRNKD